MWKEAAFSYLEGINEVGICSSRFRDLMMMIKQMEGTVGESSKWHVTEISLFIG